MQEYDVGTQKVLAC